MHSPDHGRRALPRCAISALLPLLVFTWLMGGSARAHGYDALAQQDMRLAAIADAMLIANERLCRHKMPVTGMILHSVDQYGDRTPAVFSNGPLAIAAVAPGSPAAASGLRAGDTIVAVDGTPVAHLVPEANGHLREAAFFALASLEPAKPITITRERGDRREEIVLQPEAGCRSLVEVLAGDGPNARSDGRVIQLQYDFLLTLEDTQVAVILAHELAHTVLEHRRRKEDAGIDNATLVRHLGRNQQVNRQAEVEADRLSVHLLANAGYDPALAVQFWHSPEGFAAGGGAMPSFIYPIQSARARLIESEIARYLPLRRGPSWPGHLVELRDDSFERD